MDALEAEELISRHTLTFREFRRPDHELTRVNLRGRILCRAGVVVVANEWLRVRRGPGNRYAVMSDALAYHAYRRGRPLIDLLRYDNSHDELHRHHFDADGNETRIEPIALDTLPSLDAVVREALVLADRSSK